MASPVPKNRERAQSISMLCSKVPGDAGVNAEDQEGVKSGNIRRGSSGALVSAALAGLGVDDGCRSSRRRNSRLDKIRLPKAPGQKAWLKT